MTTIYALKGYGQELPSEEIQLLEKGDSGKPDYYTCFKVTQVIMDTLFTLFKKWENNPEFTEHMIYNDFPTIVCFWATYIWQSIGRPSRYHRPY